MVDNVHLTRCHGVWFVVSPAKICLIQRRAISKCLGRKPSVTRCMGSKQYHSRHSYFGDAYHICCRMRQRRRIHGAAASSVAFCVRTLLSDAGWAGFDLISKNANARFFLGGELDALGNISPDLLSLCPTFVEPRMMQSSSNNGSSGEIEVHVLRTSRRYDRPPN